ncbi:MAG TPA: FtsX-like permease family protein [Cyclobacteriaceae bacterium]|nr:FtsX-like permease family protein [Cyclobacteriaceae bacterium]
MLTNYFKTAWRNLVRDKFYSFIKIAGLGVGLTVCLLILLYGKDEVSYDQFHANGPRIYRIIQDWKFGESGQKIGITNAIMGETFAHDISGIEGYARVNGRTVTVKKDDDIFTEETLCVDNSFFNVFSFDLLKGNQGQVLKDMYSVVISETTAEKYFGTTDVLGKSMLLKLADDFETFQVTGVMADMPLNSSIKTGILLTMEYNQKYNNNNDWLGGSLNTFVVLAPGTAAGPIESRMQEIFDSHTAEKLKEASKQQGHAVAITLSLQPFTAIHLSRPGADNGLVDASDPVYSYILTGIAVFILIIACINFINLTVAQSIRRSKEIGVRKVVGGSRKQLVAQFLAESFTVSLIAFVGAVVLTQTTLPFFNNLANKKLDISYLSDGYLYAGFFGLLIITSFLAGFYPSMVLSSFQPAKVLYNRQKMMTRNFLTKGLVVFQFALAIFLIIGTMAINSQLNFLFDADLGYDSKNLVRIDIPVSKASNPLPAYFRNELMGKPNIVSVAGKNGGRSITAIKADEKTIMADKHKIDENVVPTFRLTMAAGRNFIAGNAADTASSVIVNEALVKEAGWEPADAIGRNLGNMDNEKKPMTIVGVIKDYHFVSLKEKIGPAIYVMEPAFNYGTIWVRIEPNDIPKTLQLLEATFKRAIPFFPYKYEFTDNINAREYDSEAKWKTIIGFASALFIFISCIGLLGLVMLSIEQRTKEIGIRKVLGAAVGSIVVMITRQFVVLVVISFLIAIPAGYYAIDKWLQGFAYRIDPQWWIYAIAGGVVITAAWIITSIQAARAGMQNPVKSLRSE